MVQSRSEEKVMNIQIVRLLGVGLVCGSAFVAMSSEGMRADAQSPAQTFRAGVDYVEVDAIVTDRKGNFVRNLTKSDFTVLEDGKPQTVSVFSLVDISAGQPDRSAMSEFGDSAANQGERTNGRLYVIVLDDLHTMAHRTNRVRAAARLFVERYLGANDVAAIILTSGRNDGAQDLTDNQQLLLRAVDSFVGRKLRRADDPLDAERGYNARVALSSLRQVADRMAALRGRRKALVFISEGIDYDIHDVFNARDASIVRDEVRAAISAATRSNVSIYSVDSRGLTSFDDDESDSGDLTGGTAIGPGSSSEQLRLAQDSLRILADMTGGIAAVNSNDFGQIFERIVRDNSTYYLLGFTPANGGRDGRFRKISVRVAREDVMVRARQGYAIPRSR
jgi:VWFA-related protein